jgi:patatin-like phospholipase/acyl hydrolase
MKPACKILSIDGGGIKGIIPCIILREIENKTGHRISDLFNVVSGTSTGGIIALGLTKPNGSGANAFSADDLLNLYVKNGKEIFSKRKEDLISRIGGLLGKAKDMTANNYDAVHIERLMLEKFGETRLTDALTNTLITTYDINSGRPYYFSSRIATQLIEGGDTSENILMRDIARSTSAAPTFFAPKIISNSDNPEVAFVDGGVFANNPSILAYSEAKEVWKNDARTDHTFSKGSEAVVTPDDKDLPFYMLSLGCGATKSSVSYTNAEQWRALSWIEPLLTDVFMRSSEESVHYTMQYLLPPFVNGNLRYERLNPDIDHTLSQMDNVSDANIQALLEVANRYVKTAATQAKIDNVGNLLLHGWN